MNDVENGGERSKKSSGKKVLLCNELWANLLDTGVYRECKKKGGWSSGVLANNVLIGGCAKIIVGNTDVVVHAHQAYRVKEAITDS